MKSTLVHQNKLLKPFARANQSIYGRKQVSIHLYFSPNWIKSSYGNSIAASLLETYTAED